MFVPLGRCLEGLSGGTGGVAALACAGQKSGADAPAARRPKSAAEKTGENIEALEALLSYRQVGRSHLGHPSPDGASALVQHHLYAA